MTSSTFEFGSKKMGEYFIWVLLGNKAIQGCPFPVKFSQSLVDPGKSTAKGGALDPKVALTVVQVSDCGLASLERRPRSKFKHTMCMAMNSAPEGLRWW